MPTKIKKTKKSNLDSATIQITAEKSILNDLKSVDDMIDRKDQEIKGEIQLEKPDVSCSTRLVSCKISL